MMQFSRNVALRTLLWAALRNLNTSTEMLDTMMTSPAMHSMYLSLIPTQKALLIEQVYELRNLTHTTTEELTSNCDS